MALNLIKDGNRISPQEPEFTELNKFCEKNVIDLTFEWIDGQFWLHSDLPKEKPIGIEIDRELSRHEEYLKKSSVHKELLAKSIGVKEVSPSASFGFNGRNARRFATDAGLWV